MVALIIVAMPLVVIAAASSAQSANDVADYAAKEAPPQFESPEAVVEAFADTLSADDFEGFTRLLGLNAKMVRANSAWMYSYTRIREFTAEKLEIKDVNGSRIITIGALSWPFPFPISQLGNGKWSFDTSAGIQEIADWQITQYEIQVIATLRALIDAQRAYATVDRDGDGILEFAQKFISEKGLKDGLYWSSNSGEDESPANAFLNNAALFNAERDQGYFEYHYRILTAQGDSATGGATDYIEDGDMVKGFAFLAWPANYGETGVNTYIASNDGAIFGRDLGPDTEAAAASIDVFDPDESWVAVKM